MISNKPKFFEKRNNNHSHIKLGADHPNKILDKIQVSQINELVQLRTLSQPLKDLGSAIMTILKQSDKSWPSFVLAISETSFLNSLKIRYGEKLDAEQITEIEEKMKSFSKIAYHFWVAKSLAKWVVAYYDENT